MPRETACFKRCTFRLLLSSSPFCWIPVPSKLEPTIRCTACNGSKTAFADGLSWTERRETRLEVAGSRTVAKLRSLPTPWSHGLQTRAAARPPRPRQWLLSSEAIEVPIVRNRSVLNGIIAFCTGAAYRVHSCQVSLCNVLLVIIHYSFTSADLLF